MLDGELYGHDLSFAAITSVVKRASIDATAANPLASDVKYHVYDAILVAEPMMPFSARAQLVSDVVGRADEMATGDSTGAVAAVPCVAVDDAAHVEALHAAFVSDGYEGVMIRNGDAPYEVNARSKHLQKLKTFEDDEFKIVGFREADGNDAGTVVWECATADGASTFAVRPIGTRSAEAAG